MSKPESILQYDGSNYESWSKSVRRHLRSHRDDLWDYVDGTIKMPPALTALSTDEEKAAMKKRNKLNDAAFEIIQITMKPEKQASILSLDLAADAWKKIQEEATTETALSLLHQVRSLFRIRQCDYPDMAAYLAGIENKYQKLMTHKFILPELAISFLMIDGLNEEHAMLKALLFDKEPAKLTIQTVRTRLLEAESTERSGATDGIFYVNHNTKKSLGNKQQQHQSLHRPQTHQGHTTAKNTTTTPPSGAASSTTSDGRLLHSSGLCYHCKKPGHNFYNCHEWKTFQWQKKNPGVPAPNWALLSEFSESTAKLAVTDDTESDSGSDDDQVHAVTLVEVSDSNGDVFVQYISGSKKHPHEMDQHQSPALPSHPAHQTPAPKNITSTSCTPPTEEILHCNFTSTVPLTWIID